MTAPTSNNRKSFLIALSLGSLPLMGFWLYGLFDLDEGYYGAVVAEMNRRGEWITPYFNGKPWFEKPILLYWFAKPSVMIFGQAVGPRLPSVLATIGLLVLCGLYLKKRVSIPAGLWAMVMLGTSLLIIGIGRMMITDALLDLCICGAFLSFYESLVGKRAWRLMTAFCLGLAVLAKGPVSLPLFIAVAVWTFFADRELRPVFKGWWLLGILILGATTALWYVPAYLENGQVFVQKFFIEQNLQRFSGGDEAHKVPILLWPVYYPVILFVGLLPWSIWLFKPWMEALSPSRFAKMRSSNDGPSESGNVLPRPSGSLRSPTPLAEGRGVFAAVMACLRFRTNTTQLTRQGNPFERYLARWAVVILVFFTISGTKLPHYILPAVPPLIMILAIRWGERRPASWPGVAPLAVGYFMLANGVFIGWYRWGGFAELDKDARTIDQLVTNHGTVLTYELARVSNGHGLSLNETSNPSLGFYLDARKIRFADTSSLSELEKGLKGARGDVFVLSRPDRLTGADLGKLAKQGDQLVRWPGQLIGSKYMLYYVVPTGRPDNKKGRPTKDAPENKPVRIISSS